MDDDDDDYATGSQGYHGRASSYEERIPYYATLPAGSSREDYIEVCTACARELPTTIWTGDKCGCGAPYLPQWGTAYKRAGS